MSLVVHATLPMHVGGGVSGIGSARARSSTSQAIHPQSFFSLNSPSITVPSMLFEPFWSAADLKRDDRIRPHTARLIQGNVRRNAVANPINSAGTYSFRDRKLNKHRASKLTMVGRRTILGKRPTVRNFPLLNQGNLAKRPPRSSPAMTRPVPRQSANTPTTRKPV